MCLLLRSEGYKWYQIMSSFMLYIFVSYVVVYKGFFFGCAPG